MRSKEEIDEQVPPTSARRGRSVFSSPRYVRVTIYLIEASSPSHGVVAKRLLQHQADPEAVLADFRASRLRMPDEAAA
jgi:hypothetical protein